jgi:sulfate adenylyltransferase subunit 2
MVDKLTHLKQLEAESIHIIREVAAEFDNPVMLYSIGKDSAVMLHLARKAFFPGKLPFPVMHVDTQWKFQEMYKFRDKMVEELGLDLITHVNPDGVAQGINPFTHGSAKHTDIMKTEGLKQALDKHGFDAAFGGARRDEENPAPRSACTRSATASTAGTRKPAPGAVERLQRQGQQGRVDPCVPAVELDRTGHLAVHLP